MTVLYPHDFAAPLSRFGVGHARKVWYTVLFLPPALKAVLPIAAHPRRRVEGEIADLPVEGAWMPTGDGRRYFLAAPRVTKAAGIEVGEVMAMRFRVADQDAVDVPAELAALSRNAEARAAWDALTPGRRRGLAHRIHGAKAAATRARRVAEVMAALTGG